MQSVGLVVSYSLAETALSENGGKEKLKIQAHSGSFGVSFNGYLRFRSWVEEGRMGDGNFVVGEWG
jgi:hypothetical protein